MPRDTYREDPGDDGTGSNFTIVCVVVMVAILAAVLWHAIRR